jgi:hypothetical protein
MTYVSDTPTRENTNMFAVPPPEVASTSKHARIFPALDVIDVLSDSDEDIEDITIKELYSGQEADPLVYQKSGPSRPGLALNTSLAPGKRASDTSTSTPKNVNPFSVPRPEGVSASKNAGLGKPPSLWFKNVEIMRPAVADPVPAPPSPKPSYPPISSFVHPNRPSVGYCALSPLTVESHIPMMFTV